MRERHEAIRFWVSGNDYKRKKKSCLGNVFEGAETKINYAHSSTQKARQKVNFHDV